MAEYKKISNLALEPGKKVSDIISANNENILDTRFLDVNVEPANLSDISNFTIEYSSLPNESFKVTVDNNENEFRFNQTSKSTMGLNKYLLTDINGKSSYSLLSDNLQVIRINTADRIKNITCTAFNLSNENKVLEENLFVKLTFENIDGFDANLPDLERLSINITGTGAIHYINSLKLCKFNQLKELRVRHKCTGGIYIGKLAETIVQIDISGGNYSYIEIEGNNTPLNQNNCKVNQTGNFLVKFINCIPNDMLLNSIADSNGNYIIEN